jgi:acetyl esterase
MPIDPPIQRVFDLLAQHRGDEPAAPVSLEQRRRDADATMLLASTGPQEGVTVSDHPVTGGSPGSISVRVTRPTVFDDAPGPGLLFIHGGGWFQGNLDTAEVECGPMASLVPCVVVSVDYRLAPEHPFPVPLEDCIAAWSWLHAHTDELGIDPARVAVAGTSAGGNLAAALCLAARDRGLPLPILQLLDVPCLDLTLSSPSVHAQETQAGLTGQMVDEFAGFYVPDRAGRTNPLASPLLAPSHTGLPPAVIVVAEHDPVRDDGERYLTALHAADVPAAAVRVLSHPHGTWIIPGTTTHHLVRDLRAAALRQAFTGGA